MRKVTTLIIVLNYIQWIASIKTKALSKSLFKLKSITNQKIKINNINEQNSELIFIHLFILIYIAKIKIYIQDVSHLQLKKFQYRNKK